MGEVKLKDIATYKEAASYLVSVIATEVKVRCDNIPHDDPRFQVAVDRNEDELEAVLEDIKARIVSEINKK